MLLSPPFTRSMHTLVNNAVAGHDGQAQLASPFRAGSAHASATRVRERSPPCKAYMYQHPDSSDLKVTPLISSSLFLTEPDDSRASPWNIRGNEVDHHCGPWRMTHRLPCSAATAYA